ncbi:MAG: PPOX class F420-dependent oxidoreductase [Chloroflexi bacterium]|nr:PPOX class F420-dependent oxidoreductase [Chloroflexota bacterium]
MMALIPDSHKDLLERPVYVTLTTVLPDGQPQSSIVWWDSDGDYVRINTTRGRQKEKNMRRNARVSILALDPENPYRWLEVRGTVEDITPDGAVEHIEKLSQKYQGKIYYGGFAPAERRGQEERLTVKIRPTKVVIFPNRPR